MAAPKFRFQGTCALLTYKTHLDKIKYADWFKEQVKVPIKRIVLAHEKGDTEVGYDHTHVVFCTEKAFETKNVRFFDYCITPDAEAIHPNIKPIKNTKTGKPLIDALKYICKEDPENKAILDEINASSDIAIRVWDKETIQDALMLCHKPSDATGIIALFNHKQREVTIHPEDVPKYKWQLDLMKEFSKDFEKVPSKDASLPGTPILSEAVENHSYVDTSGSHNPIIGHAQVT